ncbi:MAG: hypothetical protein ACJ72O_06205, partial [Marmoricola sp.]
MHARPVIAPGLPVLARPDGVLQIGLSPRHRVQIPDSPAVRRTLAGLVRGEVPTDHSGRRVMARLEPALRDRDALVHPGLPPRETAALHLRHPRTAGGRLTDRGRTAVEVIGDLGTDPGPLLAASGLGAARRPARTVSLLLCSGEPDRVSLDPLLRERKPFLLLRAVEGELVLGPFVEPGLTACLRCIDAHLGEQDPMHPVLVSRAARLVEARELPEPIDAATVG